MGLQRTSVHLIEYKARLYKETTNALISNYQSAEVLRKTAERSLSFTECKAIVHFYTRPKHTKIILCKTQTLNCRHFKSSDQKS